MNIINLLIINFIKIFIYLKLEKYLKNSYILIKQLIIYIINFNILFQTYNITYVFNKYFSVLRCHQFLKFL